MLPLVFLLFIILLTYNIVVAHEVSVVLRLERTEGSRNAAWLLEEAVQQGGHTVGIDTIEVEVATDGAHLVGYDGEGGTAELRTFARDGCIIGEDDASVGLLETDVGVLTDEQQSVALLVGQQGCVYTTSVSLEIEVALLQCPEAIATGTIAAGIGGHESVAYPLHTVDATVEQEGYAEFGKEGVGRVGCQRESIVRGVAL